MLSTHEQDQLQDALDSYKHALRLKPDLRWRLPSIWVLSTQKQDQLQDALDSYKHALRLRPDYADAYKCMGAEAYYNMGIVYDEQDQLQDALDADMLWDSSLT